MSGRHLVVTVVGTLLCSAAVISSSVSQHSTVYVSVSDRDEIAVKGLTTKDFVVKVDGRDSVVLNTPRRASLSLSRSSLTQLGFCWETIQQRNLKHRVPPI